MEKRRRGGGFEEEEEEQGSRKGKRSDARTLTASQYSWRRLCVPMLLLDERKASMVDASSAPVMPLHRMTRRSTG
jgi:hypothetical protein